jgi:23S rRNA pseudouridine1911/1915/1917 synthase
MLDFESLPPLQVLCEDGPLLAFNKPAGVLTQGVPQGVPTLEGQVRQYLKTKYDKPGNVYLGIPHRLDRPVSGVIVFARNSKAAARLAEQFRERQVRKFYRAVTEAVPEVEQNTLTDWLLKDAEQSHVEVVPPDTPAARECVLRYRTLAVHAGRALLEIELLTGRMHQIRVQLASRGWPIVGDVKYGAASPWLETPDDPRANPIALHAHRLELRHPIRYDEMAITAPVPECWSDLP